MGGLIVFSYSHLEEGVSDPADGINLALHEMAHALHIENSIKNREFGFIDSSALGRLKELFYQELEHLQSGESNFLRTYAGENFHEFFAVCVENFFERPAAFYAQKPEVFRSLSQVLNQNPLVPA